MPSPLQMIDDIHNVIGIAGGIELDNWEEEFLDSLEDRLGEGKGLTEKQRNKLEEIWDRI